MAGAGDESGQPSLATQPARRTEDGSDNPIWALVGLTCEPRVVALEGQRLLLGRGADCDVVLATDEASRQHAEVTRVGPMFVVRDLGSSNGTFLGGRAVREAPLLPHSVLRLGEWIGVVVQGRPEAGVALQQHGSGLWGGAALGSALAAVRTAAASDLPILIEGETGTGKELVARAVHEWSTRRGAFVAINCAAVPAALAEGELFGYRRGAFTGADRASPGHLRAADGGTLLLDEVVDLPAALQTKLLRVLEQGEVVPLGDSTPVRIDVRVVAAAQGSLQKAVAEQRFRADLYARLGGMTVRLPALRERVEDVPALLRHFMREAGMRRVPEFSVNALEALCAYDWPFNVRELRLLSRRLAVLQGGEAVIHRRALPDHIRAAGPGAEVIRESGVPPPTEASELDRLIAGLRAHGGNVSRAARAAGISRMRAYRLMNANPELDLEAFRQGDAEP